VYFVFPNRSKHPELILLYACHQPDMQSAIFLLHVLATFGDTIGFMSHPRVKIIFLLLILCANSLQADQVIRSAQTKLAALGYYKARVDGSPGSMTSAAIRRFQLAKKLKVTGSLNQQTLDALGINAPPPAPDYSKINELFDGGPLSGKDSAAQVEAIRDAQRVLAESGLYAGPHNGLPSATLTASINEWQLAQGLPQTGKLDTHTLAGLGIARN
jgi:peptidoglycan hydrolase-like protein with peptidoglycan-binding domain